MSRTLTMAGVSAYPRIASLLVVEDSVVQRRHMVGLCRELGIESIYEAGNGTEALELLSMLVLRPSLMIVDLEMPGMDGIELIQQLHRQRLDIPLIVASRHETALIESVEAMGGALGVPVLAGLRKPLTADVLGSAFARYAEATDVASTAAERVAAPADKAELAQAIANGDIIPHYQPKVDIRTGIVRGVEALARWRHAEKGMLSPAHFIMLAEREGLIRELTLSIMGQALAQAEAWNRRGLKLSVAVNFSPLLLDSYGLVEEISELLQRHSLQAGQIVLEITEGSVIGYLGASLGVLARLRLRGFGLSIDDYGTGFSSMQQLARIPFTELKIDRSFVHGAHQRKNLRVILQSALDLARRLELVTVAEGIETPEDWRLVQRFGCDIGQGFLIAKPMVAADLPRWLKTHRGRLHELRAQPSPSRVG